MHRKATATRRATIQPRLPPGETQARPRRGKKGVRDIRVSRFMITVNTNQTWEDNQEAMGHAQELADVLDSIGFEGSTCALWGHFFKVPDKRTINRV